MGSRASETFNGRWCSRQKGTDTAFIPLEALRRGVLFPACLQIKPAELVCVQYLLQDGVDPVHFTVDEKAFLLPAVHLLNDASVLHRVQNVPHRASCHLPVIGYSRLHDGLEDCKTWRSRGRRALSHICFSMFISE